MEQDNTDVEWDFTPAEETGQETELETKARRIEEDKSVNQSIRKGAKLYECEGCGRWLDQGVKKCGFCGKRRTAQ